MTAYIKTLKDKQGNQLLPRTRTDAVTTVDGILIDTKLNELLQAVTNFSYDLDGGSPDSIYDNSLIIDGGTV